MQFINIKLIRKDKIMKNIKRIHSSQTHLQGKNLYKHIILQDSNKCTLIYDSYLIFFYFFLFMILIYGLETIK
jgi:hypothetical protein